MQTSNDGIDSEPSSTPQLLCIEGKQIGMSIPLADKELTLGRLSASDVCLLDLCASRRHAKIARKGDSFLLFDLRSSNGTQVNGISVSEHILQHGDEIRIGFHRFLFLTEDPQTSFRAPKEDIRILDDSERGRTITFRRSVSTEEIPLSTVCGEAVDTSMDDTLRKQIDFLYGMAQAMIADIDQPHFLHKIAAMLRSFLDAERVCILVQGSASGMFEPAAASFRTETTDRKLPLSRTIIEKVIKDRISLLCSDAMSDERFEKAGSVEVLHIRSVMCAPLISRGSLLGLLYVDNRSLPDEFSEEDLKLLSTSATQVALAIENYQSVTGMRQQLRYLEEKAEGGRHGIVGKSAAFLEVVDVARKAAESNATILILGESGTGKEVLAQSIHRWSMRSNKPFVVVNCAALSEGLLQSDLFGHERGAFTGAVKQKKGRLELADSGTAFLDEIGELDLEMQVKLLRFLEEREFERVGGTRSIRVDARIIAASNRDLAKEVREGRFREDLYYRLRVVELKLPPLRRRTADIEILAEKFLQDCAREIGRQILGFSKDALVLLREQDWPGNIRELRNAVERAAVLSTGEMIEAGDLSFGHPQSTIRVSDSLVGFHEKVREFKKQVILEALENVGGAKGRAAERLGIGAPYLSRLMKNLGMR